VLRWINGRNPMHMFDSAVDAQPGSGTGAAEFDVTLSLASIGTMRARLNLTAQKPLQRALPTQPGKLSSVGSMTYIQPCPGRPTKITPTFFFWTNRASRIIGACRPGRRAVRHPLSSVPATAQV